MSDGVSFEGPFEKDLPVGPGAFAFPKLGIVQSGSFAPKTHEWSPVSLSNASKR
eukprot:TRINITY_DN3368_c0_g1_i2.p3 TRINITY_DN3368_c0_g1~~TRINITY_DN3368_c0_g1_i2.p3  ORF type:complete len:54 (-),score=14.87 TRINITY_DN3368_c0_g1_i2:47-208(-)